jgi:hypothetical protein
MDRSHQPAATIATPAFKSAQRENIVTQHFKTYVSKNARLLSPDLDIHREHRPPEIRA